MSTLSLRGGSKRVVNFTFLGSLYKEVEKLLPELWSIASRDKPPEKNFFLPKTLCPQLRMQDFYLRNLQIASFCTLMSYFAERKLKKIPIDPW